MLLLADMLCLTHKIADRLSLIATCRLHDINPYDYLVDVRQRVGQHPAAQFAEMTPRLWKIHFAENPLRSPLDQSAR